MFEERRADGSEDRDTSDGDDDDDDNDSLSSASSSDSTSSSSSSSTLSSDESTTDSDADSQDNDSDDGPQDLISQITLQARPMRPLPKRARPKIEVLSSATDNDLDNDTTGSSAAS